MGTRKQSITSNAKSLNSKVLNNQFKLKPISFVVLTMLAQAAWVHQAHAQEQAEAAAVKRAQTARSALQLPKPMLLADNSLDVYDVLLGDAKAVKLPTTSGQYKEIILTAEVTDSKPSESANPNNKINTPNLSKDSKTLNKKAGSDLPLGNKDASGKVMSDKQTDIQLKEVKVRAKRFHEIGPLPGLGLTKEQIPGNVQSITAKEIKESHSLSLTDLLNKKLQSVNVNDYQGNPFQMDVTYRGFTAGPQIGTPQGLSVFFDGIRVNEPFGDVVNWDMIPMNAIAGVDVFPGSNPIFGLNTLGGAFTLKTKDGFTNEGIDAEVLTGSFGRKQLQVEGGWNNGDFALFGAGNFFLEDGWRENSPSKVNQVFGKASYRGDKLDLSFSTLIVGTDLVGNGLLPTEMYKQDRNGSFTAEDTTKNRLQQFQLSGSYFVNDHFTVTGQVYRRNSKRHQKGADVYTDFEEDYVARKLLPGEEYTCLYNSTGQAATYGLPDYYVVDIEAGADLNSTTNPFVRELLDNNNLNLSLPGAVFNQDLSTSTNLPTSPSNYLAHAQYLFNIWKNFKQGTNYVPQAGSTEEAAGQIANAESYSNGEAAYLSTQFIGGGFVATPQDTIDAGNIFVASTSNFYYTPDGVKHLVVVPNPVNGDTCIARNSFTEDLNFPLAVDPVTGLKTPTDGANDNSAGVVEGTPTAVLTDNQIDQITDGASIQLNWNFEQHKFMVGASIDRPTADYSNKQRLGLLDENRKAFLAPDQIREQYAAASIPLSNNDFSGESTTKSIYASETWSPVETLHINGALRYNDTHGKNKIASRVFGFTVLDLNQFVAAPDAYNLIVNGVRPPTGYKIPDLSNLLNAAETEKFSYYSLNPSFGATWQAKENLNVYANWAQGTRTPSVIELGCALDKTPTLFGNDANGNPIFIPKGIAENRTCSLPSNLSGDPYLPQIKATTYDVGMRGNFAGLLGTEGLEWNLGAYQTDLKDDIYFVALQDGRGFFDTIGNTRRRGLEAGLSGKKDKWGFGVNYSLTDATFQNNFLMFSTDNSSAQIIDGLGEGVIEVKKGSRMPGVPLHNLNANISYEITPKWQVGLTAVVHSESIVRGNENNEHKKGVVRLRQVMAGAPGAIVDPVTGASYIALPPTNNSGKVPGYATFNFQTSYKFNSEWTATMQVNNLFDKEFFSAGRLGINPFSPTLAGGQGAIGPDGYNHNSNNWLSDNFIAPSAPRGIWFSLNWQFDAKK